ncbi:hypothetical protein [Streptomyces sp. NPDC058683]|uniref:hypothetical protein n=1 Tax=Streptomyces sp. NPDC058683 TaxID=3346597 RepID=UPI003669E7B1
MDEVVASAFAGDGAELVGGIRCGGEVGAGFQDAFELVAPAVGQGVGAANDAGGDSAGAGDRPCWFGVGGAGSEGRDVLGDDDAASAVAAFANVAEGACGVDRAAAEALLQVRLEAVDVAVEPALSCGGEDLVEVGRQVGAHRLAVPTQAVGNRADRPAAFAQLVDVGVPLPDAGQELAV